LALGLLLGAIEVPLPGGGSFSLGFAGGPLVVELVLGTLRWTGPFQWQPSYTAGLTLRQFGLVLFLAGIFTQPATLAFATRQAHTEEPEQAYAEASPFAILLKILLAQVVLLVLLA
jgi:putative transport protein